MIGSRWYRVGELVGVEPHTAYDLIDRGELLAQIRERSTQAQSGGVRVQRTAVDEYLERVRIRPGDLRHLYPQ